MSPESSLRDQKLTQMSLNLRSSLPKDAQSSGFRKNKTFEFNLTPQSRTIEAENSRPELPAIRDVAADEEVILQKVPNKFRKKPQLTLSETENRGESEKVEETKAEELPKTEIVKTISQDSVELVHDNPKELNIDNKETEFELEKNRPLAPKNQKKGGPKKFNLTIDSGSEEPAAKGEENQKQTNEAPTQQVEGKNLVSSANTEKEQQKAEPKPKFKKKLTMGLDTDEINKQFTFGGEQGLMLARDNEEVIIEQDVFDLAKKCVDFMSNKLIL